MNSKKSVIMKKQRQSKTTLVDKGSTETLTDKSVEQTTVRKGKKIAESFLI